jgi:hypothetical protein
VQSGCEIKYKEVKNEQRNKTNGTRLIHRKT